MAFVSFAGHVWKWLMRLFIYLFTFSLFLLLSFFSGNQLMLPTLQRELVTPSDQISRKKICRFSHKGIFFKTEDSRRWRGGRRAMVAVWVKKRGQLVNLNSTGHRGNVHDPAKRSQPHRLVNHSHTHARAHTHTRTPPQPRGQSSWVNWGYQEPLEGGEERGEKVVF